MPTVTARSSRQNGMGFYLKATEFSCHHRGKPRWLWLAKVLGSAHTTELKSCQSHSFVLTVTKVVGSPGPLGFF